MRTPTVIIERVVQWLEHFTLAELMFVLNEDARMYPFDKFRVQKIALAVRHTFASDQSDEQVRKLIEDLSSAYCQTRPVVKPTSISSITIRQNYHQLVPFRLSCPICYQSADITNSQQRRIQIYCCNGSVLIGTMFMIQCHHRKGSHHTNNNNSPVTIYPNFIQMNDQNIYTYESLHFGEYVYLGGNIAAERRLIEKYIAQIVHHDISMVGSAASMNQEALNCGHQQLVPVDRRVLMNVIHTFLLIQLDISFGNQNISVPSKLKDFTEWSWKQFPRLLSCFIYLWTNHRSIIGPCGEHCSKCLIIDGHQKCRRRICAFKDVKVNTEEMSDLVIGCCRTPVKSSRYCEFHSTWLPYKTSNEPQARNRKKRNVKRIFRQYYNKSSKNNDHLNVTGCRTLKARSDQYLKRCTRSFGIIALVTNCRIITSFSELYRSETLREIINLFAITVRVAGNLAPTCVYDDGCHLVQYVKNHIGRDLTRTPAMDIFASTPISVDRSHFRNHIGKFCRQTMNPDKNPLLKNVNTQAAEQTFSWLKNYANIMSNMGHQRAPLFMLILFHLKNLSTVNKSSFSVFNIASGVPKIDGVSLCHVANDMCQQTPTEPENTTITPFHIHKYDLPKGTSDWDLKLFNIMNKNK